MAKGRKGKFTEAELARAGRYVHPRSRRRELLVGLALCAGVALVLLLGWARRGTRIVARAPLASAHATFEVTCRSCHTPFGGVADAGCLGCHERFAAPEGVYGIAAHAATNAGAEADATGVEAPACASCHPEHRGREATPVAVADAQCVSCHAIGSFTRGHPELAFARENLPDERYLRFPHRLHVARVREEKGLAEPQAACLYCHVPEADGAGFLPLDFDRQCGECHLSSRTGTPRLPVGDPADAASVGVLTLDAIRASGRPGTRWAFFANPAEVEERGGRVQKRPVYHADPWILENLRRIREVLHPDEGLTALLTTLAPDDGGDDPALYAEAIAALRARVAELRARPEPEVQEDLATAERLLALAEERLALGEAPAGAFAAGPAAPLPAEHAEALRGLALELTEPCRRCHTVTDAAIRRVTEEQSVLRRARFDHRAHVLLTPLCVDCHAVIPDLLAPPDPAAPVAEADAAIVHNLPTIEVCRSCHTEEAASPRCVTCHDFHPRGGERPLLAAAPPATAGEEG